MKKIKISLLVKVLIAIVLGMACAQFFPTWAVRIFATTNSLIGSFIGMFIPLLIIGLISSGIADLGKGAGKMLLLTAGIAYLSTILAGAFSFTVCSFTMKDLVGGVHLMDNGSAVNEFAPYFEIQMPPFIDVTTALIVSFILGIAMTFIQGKALKQVMDDFRDVVTLVIGKVIVPLLPLFIFGIFLNMGAQGAVSAQLKLLAKIVIIIFAMHVTILVLQYVIAGIITKRNPFKALIKMLPAYATALGTSSSAATIPVTLAQAKKNGIRSEIADFVIPLCATIHMPCSLLKIVACAYALMVSMGLPIETVPFIRFILMAGIALVAAPGVPGGCIMAALGPLSAILGFTEPMQGMMIALYIAMDSFGTAGNVTGDGAIAMIIDKAFRKKELSL